MKRVYSICVCSLFRNSENNVDTYFANILRLRRKNVRLSFVLIEGDSSDNTYGKIESYIKKVPRLILKKIDKRTIVYGSVANPVRLKALSELANDAIVTALRFKPDYILWLESDILYDYDILERLIQKNKDLIAPLVLRKGSDKFYDIWAFRSGNKINENNKRRDRGWLPRGCFTVEYPYHECFNPDKPFEVDSCGSVLLIKSKVVIEGARFSKKESIVGFCKSAKKHGFSVWVDPTTKVYHPNTKTIKLITTFIKREIKIRLVDWT